MSSTTPSTSPSIPILDARAEAAAFWDELQPAVEAVLRSGEYIMGTQVRTFEAEVAAYLGVRHAIGVNSGTDALVIGLKALGIGPGDEVITTPFTFFATAEAVSMVGARPVFVDVDPLTFALDVGQVEAAVNRRTRAILPVHLYGHAADMGPLMALAAAYGLKVVEDVAQAFGGAYQGQKLGTLGDVGAFSFFPTKNLGGCGDGGLITTNDDAVADQARMLRVHGARKKYHNEVIGYNSRLDELQAAILRVKLPHLDAQNERRRQVALRYGERLAGLPDVILPSVADGVTHVFHQYTLRVAGGQREAFAEALAAAGISTMVYYPTPVHRLPVYRQPPGTCPVAEALASEVLSLPIWPQMTEDVQAQVIAAVRRYWKA